MKSIKNIYKIFAVQKLKEYDKWGYGGGVLEIDVETEKGIIQLDINGPFLRVFLYERKGDSPNFVCRFLYIFDIPLLYHILKFKYQYRRKEKLNERMQQEELMRKYLPDDFLRSIKLNEIKKKL